MGGSTLLLLLLAAPPGAGPADPGTGPTLFAAAVEGDAAADPTEFVVDVEAD